MNRFHSALRVLVLAICPLLQTSYIAGPERGAGLPEVKKCLLSGVAVAPDLDSPVGMIVAGGHLVVYESKVDPPFKVFNLPSDGVATGALSRGTGSGKVLGPDPKSFVPADEGFLLVDADKTAKRLAFKDGKLVVTSRKAIPGLKLPLNGVYPFRDGYICLSPTFDAYEYIDTRTGKVSRICKGPQWENNLSKSPNVVFRLSWATVHPDGRRFAIFHMFRACAVYYDSDGNVTRQVSLPLSGVKDSRWEEAPVHYMGVIASNDKWIVANYGNREYHFFDWGGNLIRRVALDGDLFPVTFDFASNTFYGIDRSERPMRLCSAKVGFEPSGSVSYKSGVDQIYKK